MNKKTVYNILLIAFPAVAILLASGGNSVRILDRTAGTYTYQSYFSLLPEGTFQMSTVLAMGLAMAALVFAIVYVVSGKHKCLKGIYLVTFASVFAAEIPTLLQNELLVVPNVLVPILLIADCAMAYYKMKRPEEEKKKQKQGERLQARR